MLNLSLPSVMGDKQAELRDRAAVYQRRQLQSTRELWKREVGVELEPLEEIRLFFDSEPFTSGKKAQSFYFKCW